MKTEIPVCPKIKTEAYKSVFIASETPDCHTLEKYLLSSLSHWIKELSSCIAMERLTTQSNKTKTKNPHILQDLGLWHILLNFLRQLTHQVSVIISCRQGSVLKNTVTLVKDAPSCLTYTQRIQP